MLPTYKMYLDDWSQDAEVYGKVFNWDDKVKLNKLYCYAPSRGVGRFFLAAVRPWDSAIFPYIEQQVDLHKYSHIPELTSDQVDQLIFIHLLDH